MLEYGIAGLLGEGLKSFSDSYSAEKDRQRRQAQADDERAMRARQVEREDFTSGVKWDPETKTYSSTDGTGYLTKNEQKQMSGLLEAQKAAGENWFRNDYAPYRTALSRLMMKSFGERGPDGNAPVASVGGVSMPQAQPQTRQGLIAQTEALGQIPSVPTNRPQAKGLIAKPQAAPASPYAPLKSKIMGRHAPGFNPSEWAPGYTPKSEKEQLQKNQSDLFNIEMKEAERGAAPQEKMQSDIAGAVANQATIASGIKQVLDQLEDPKVSDDQKVIAGREALKLLNSQQGKDAIGAEEARRLGGLLEFHMFNLVNPGPAFGRDIPGFTDQVRNNYNRLQKSIVTNEELLGKAKRGESLAPAPAEKKTGLIKPPPKVGEVKGGYVFKGGDPADPRSWGKK